MKSKRQIRSYVKSIEFEDEHGDQVAAMAIRVVRTWQPGDSLVRWLAAHVQNDLKAMGFNTFFETMPDSVLARQEY